MNLAQFARYINKKVILIALATFSLFAAINNDISLLYGMFALLSSVLLISFFLSRVTVRKIECHRLMNNLATEDEELAVTVRVESRGRFPQFMLQVEDQFTAASLNQKRETFLIPKLSYNKGVELHYKKLCYKRGEYSVGPFNLSSASPLGLFSRKKIMDVRSPLLVYPSTFSIDYLPLVSGSFLPRIGVETLCKAGTSDDFFGTREYKSGDPVKYIHWPSSARLGRIVVKEFEMSAATDITIVLDLEMNSSIGHGKENTLEYAVKVAASIAKYAISRANSVQFIAYGERQIIIPSSHGLNQLSRILEELARIKANGRIPFCQTIANVQEYIQEGSTVALIFSVVDSESLLPLSDFVHKHVKILAVVLNDNSFKDTKTSLFETEDYTQRYKTFVQGLIAQGAIVYSISKGDDLSRRLEVALNWS